MFLPDPSQSKTLGADIRALRKARKMTLQMLADKTNRSVGWLSQVERDISNASISDLRDIVAALGAPMSMLFRNAPAPAEEAGFIVRAGARRPIGSSVEGLLEELLSPDLTDNFELVHSTFLPGTELTTPVQRATQEVAYLVSGKLDLHIDKGRFTINKGDSFRLRGENYRWANPYSEPAIAIWAISPPVY